MSDDPITAARQLIFEEGLKQRREVLGDAWVERSLAGRTPFSHDFQDMITRNAWGEVWTRGTLDQKTRRFLVLAMTIGMGRWEEFSLHVRAGLERNGFTQDELKEIILQAAVYCGVPAANTAMHHAAAIVKDLATPEAP